MTPLSATLTGSLGIQGSVTHEFLMECFAYDHETGDLRWKARPREHFATARGWRCFNSNDAGNIAGTKTSSGYLVITLLGRRYAIHRVIWMISYGTWPTLHIDHINGNRTDNRLSNLREATDAENSRNCRKHKDNKSGLKGVYFNKRRRKYHSQIMVNGIKKHIGYFLSQQDAHAAYCAAADKGHGKFANHGDIK